MTQGDDDGSNPPAPALVFTILLVCTANICRSPMAEHLLRGALEAAPASSGRPRFQLSSAGVRGWDNASMDPAAAAELRRLGGDPSAFRSRSFTASQAEGADLILTATVEHRRHVLREAPRTLRRTFTLLEFAHLVSAVGAVTRAVGDPVEVVRRASASRGAARLDVCDVADPYGLSFRAHRETAESLKAVTQTIADALLAPVENTRLD